MWRNVSINLTKASFTLRICCSALLANIRENHCLFVSIQ
jgi:hypothetical protein